jgi:serine/threonine-protein kinase
VPDVPTQLAAALSDVYRIERELGRGGMATVYLARDLRHNRPVALKVLKPELGAVLGVERFLSEIQVTANLQHPNLLPLFDSGEANGLLYYVMPYVEGETLRHRLDREKQLPIDEALHIAIAIAGALDYAHQQGVVHRDLKPENILLQHGQPVLADFGIALAVANAGGTRVTQTGLSLGTPKYMSPEQATGDRVIDGRTDIYSLAAVLYECLTGEPPHEGNTAQAIIARLLSEKPRSVRSSRERVPDHVEAAIERGLAKLAADRFSTARDFAQALSGPPVGSYTGRVTSGFTTTTTADREVRITFALSAARLKTIGLWTIGVIAVALGLLGWIRPRPEAATPHVRFALDLTDSLRPREDAPGQNIALSPDGMTLVYVGGLGTPQLFMRRLDDREPHPVPGTAGAISPKVLARRTIARLPGEPDPEAHAGGRGKSDHHRRWGQSVFLGRWRRHGGESRGKLGAASPWWRQPAIDCARHGAKGDVPHLARSPAWRESNPVHDRNGRPGDRSTRGDETVGPEDHPLRHRGSESALREVVVTSC